MTKMKHQRSKSSAKGWSNSSEKATIAITTTSSSSSRTANTSSPKSSEGNNALTPSRGTATKRNNSLIQEQQASYKKWKRQESHDYNTHQFLDSSASVHAGLFGARRLPEIKSLWRHIVQGGLHNALNNSSAAEGTKNVVAKEATRRPGESGGGKISSRHLRRRTNSHKPRRRDRFFTRTSVLSSSHIPGDEFKKRKREEDIHTVVETRENTSKTTAIEHQNSKRTKPPCRRARRKPSLLRAHHSLWWKPKTHAQLPEPSSLSKNSVHNWITTHLWHAKRFHMSPKLFDAWSIPLLHCNRGSRASLRLASSETSPKCTIQDGTWEVNGCMIVLEVRNCKKDIMTPQSLKPTSPSSALQSIISIILQRLCGSDASFLKDEGVVLGNLAGEGIVYEMDSCPLRPIGPATFVFNGSADSDDSRSASVGILVHPAMYRRVIFQLNRVLQEYENNDNSLSLSTLPLVLLRIRGRASTATVQKILGQTEHDNCVQDDVVNTHGRLIELVRIPTFLDTPSNRTRPWIKMKCHKPNQNFQHLPHNLASSGWDIYCHPSIGSLLFQSFAISGGACAIGLVEDARAQLEAYPPLSIFPRDYPDTEDGRLYWNGGVNATPTISEDDIEYRSSVKWQDWVVIRTCIEGGWGRINTELKRTIRHWNELPCLSQKKSSNKSDINFEINASLPQLITNRKLLCRKTVSVDWQSLTATDHTEVIVVRGLYGIPFVQLFLGCGKPFPQIANVADGGRKRRPRRPVRLLESVHASPLSNVEAAMHSDLCRQLMESLSLPALLRCELYCEGKGSMNVGDIIYPLNRCYGERHSDDSDLEDETGVTTALSNNLSPLGIVIGGGFSPNRGKYHGIGFVGAAKLIDALNGTTHGMGLIVPETRGQRKMALQIMIVRNSPAASCSSVALLSILL